MIERHNPRHLWNEIALAFGWEERTVWTATAKRRKERFRPRKISMSFTPSRHAPLQKVIATLPIGSKVISTKDGLQGVVLGHKQDSGKATYVRLWVDGEDKYYQRAASTLEVKTSHT